MTHHERVYDRAAVYDLAFSWRDYAMECDFLLAAAHRWGPAEPGSFLEVAAGPANHAREMARRGLASTALDRSPGMVAYGSTQAESEKVSLTYREGDMERFSLPAPVDLAACMMVGWAYLLDNDAVLRHLACAAAALVDGGIYLVELPHPRDLLTTRRSAETVWEVERDGVKVSTRWGLPDDVFDPVTQVRQVTVEMDVEDADGKRTVRELAPERAFGPNEVRALIEASGSFELVALLGALDVDLPMDDEKHSWRMLPVLRKHGGTA